jgi:hypothetical protein
MHCPGQMACWASVELESDLILLKQKLCLQLIGPCLQQHNLRIRLPQRLEASPRRTSHCSQSQPTLARTSSFACLADCSSAWMLQQRSRSASRLCCDADSAASTSCSLQEIPTEQRWTRESAVQSQPSTLSVPQPTGRGLQPVAPVHLLPRHTICRFQLVELRVERCSLRRVLCAAPNALARLAHHDSSMHDIVPHLPAAFGQPCIGRSPPQAQHEGPESPDVIRVCLAGHGRRICVH